MFSAPYIVLKHWNISIVFKHLNISIVSPDGIVYVSILPCQKFVHLLSLIISYFATGVSKSFFAKSGFLKLQVYHVCI